MTRGRFGGTRGWLEAKSRRFGVDCIIVAVKTVAMVVGHRAVVAGRVDLRIRSFHRNPLHLADPCTIDRVG